MVFNPESVNLSALPWVTLDTVAGLPARPGIYFAIDRNGSVQYIGRSTNVQNRWKGHHRREELEKLGGVKIVYLLVDSFEMLSEIESALIAWFDPPLNIIGSPSRRTKNLASQDRLTIELKGLRHRVENYSSDPAWKQLSIAGKIRALIEIALREKMEPR